MRARTTVNLKRKGGSYYVNVSEPPFKRLLQETASEEDAAGSTILDTSMCPELDSASSSRVVSPAFEPHVTAAISTSSGYQSMEYNDDTSVESYEKQSVSSGATSYDQDDQDSVMYDQSVEEAATILFQLSRKEVPSPASAQPRVRTTLALPQDEEHLNSLHCYVRKELLLLTTIGECSRKVSSNMDKDRVGLQCRHCAHLGTHQERDTGAAFFPKSVEDVYRSVCTWQRTHFQQCRCVPKEVREEYWRLKHSDKTRGKVRYWTDSAHLLGLKNRSGGASSEKSHDAHLGDSDDMKITSSGKGGKPRTGIVFADRKSVV